MQEFSYFGKKILLLQQNITEHRFLLIKYLPELKRGISRNRRLEELKMTNPFLLWKSTFFLHFSYIGKYIRRTNIFNFYIQSFSTLFLLKYPGIKTNGGGLIFSRLVPNSRTNNCDLFVIMSLMKARDNICSFFQIQIVLVRIKNYFFTLRSDLVDQDHVKVNCSLKRELQDKNWANCLAKSCQTSPKFLSAFHCTIHFSAFIVLVGKNMIQPWICVVDFNSIS